jgi:hypothetical protein
VFSCLSQCEVHSETRQKMTYNSANPYHCDMKHTSLRSLKSPFLNDVNHVKSSHLHLYSAFNNGDMSKTNILCFSNSYESNDMYSFSSPSWLALMWPRPHAHELFICKWSTRRNAELLPPSSPQNKESATSVLLCFSSSCLCCAVYLGFTSEELEEHDLIMRTIFKVRH